MQQFKQFSDIGDLSKPARLIVILKGEAKTHQIAREGIYNIGPISVNNKPHWIQEHGENAIWGDKDKSSWRIGRWANLGKDMCGLFSYQTFEATRQLPHNVTGWKYYSNQWIKADDMITVKAFGKYFLYVNS